MKKWRIGTSGWSYAHWEEVFYSDIPPQNRLAFYAEVFNTVEINTTFYHLPKLQVVKNWVAQVPSSFCFSVKASRFITHIKRLKNCSQALNSLYRILRPFKKQLGPILFQLPPSLSLDLDRLQNFIALLKPGFRYTFEFRSPTWLNQEVYALLKKNKIALCVSDLNGKCTPIQVTAPFVYIRLHGPKQSYRGAYGKRRLLLWKKRISQWVEEQKRVYLYFDNDDKGLAVEDAKTLLELLEN